MLIFDHPWGYLRSETSCSNNFIETPGWVRDMPSDLFKIEGCRW